MKTERLVVGLDAAVNMEVIIESIWTSNIGILCGKGRELADIYSWRPDGSKLFCQCVDRIGNGVVIILGENDLWTGFWNVK